MEENTKKSKRNLFAKPSTYIWIIILLLIISAAGSSFYVVDQTESPGLHYKLPFGIDKNYLVKVTIIQTEQCGFKTVKSGRNNEYKNNIASESTMLTGDLNIVDVEWTIQYRITDPVKWLFGVEEKENTIRDISRSVINTLVGDRAILDVMSSERSTIENQAVVMMNNNFNQFGLGITVQSVKLQNIIPPTGVQDAFEDVNKAVQDMNRFINEGKEAYNAQIPKAQGEADQQLQIAEGYAAERVNMAKGDVARFNSVYEEYKKSPVVTKERIYLEAMDEIFGSDKKPDLIDGQLDNILPVKNLTGGKND